MNALAYFNALHRGETWQPWRTFISAVYGLELEGEDLETFERHTGREAPAEGGYAEAVVVVGVQSGKSTVCGALAGHAAVTGEPGTHALLIAQDSRGVRRSLLRYAREPFERIDEFRAEVARETADTLELARGTFLSAYPCRPAAVRGLRASVVCIDELAFFTATDGRPTDTEMLRVARGRVATTGGKLLILSSPYGQSGALWELHRRHHGVEDSPVLVWQASAQDMNPTLRAGYLERMEQEDPEAYRSEVLGEFRKGLATFLDPDALADVVADGVRQRASDRRERYHGFVDAASGSGKDNFAVAIAHLDGERAVLDVCRAWSPPFDPSAVIREAVELFKRFGIYRVSGDKYAPGFVESGFKGRGITYEGCKRSTSETYLEFLPLVMSGAVSVLDDPALLRELRGLERRTGANKDRVDHRRGAHDDRAIAAAGALVAAAGREPKQDRRVVRRTFLP